MESVSKLPRLKVLKISGSRLSTLDLITRMPLTKLLLSGVHLTGGDCQLIAKMNTLKSLTLEYNVNLDDIKFKPISQMSNLEKLKIGGSRITQESFKDAKLDKLYHLDVMVQGMGSKFIEYCWNMPSLRCLRVTLNDSVSDCKSLSKLKMLQVLNISGCRTLRFNFEDISGFSYLRTLTVGHCLIDYDGLKSLTKLTKLHLVPINQKPDLIFSNQLLSLPLLENLCIPTLKLTMQMINHIAKIPSLRIISVGQLNKAMIDRLRKVPHLEYRPKF